MIFSTCFQKMNVLAIRVINNWSDANNSSFLVNLLQTRNMPEPQFARWAQNQGITLLAKGATPPILVFVCFALVDNFRIIPVSYKYHPYR